MTYLITTEITKPKGGLAEAAEVLEGHVHVVGHVGVGGLLTVGVVPASHVFSSLNKLLKQFFIASFEQYV